MPLPPDAGNRDLPDSLDLPDRGSRHHMTAEQFRAAGHELVDWIADHLEGVGERPVMSTLAPGAVRAALAEAAPARGEDFAAMRRDLDEVVVPGTTHWPHPGWFAYFPTGNSYPSILGEMASAALGAQGMLWSTSPALTEVEQLVLDWMVDLLGLPATWRMDAGPGGGVLQMSASDSTHTALVVARHEAVEAGADPADVVAYASSQAHSSIEKGARVAGYRHVRAVPVDDAFAMDVEALRRAVEDDVAAGLVPTFVCSAVGTTGTTAVDDVAAIADVAHDAGLWHHVDAAYAGTAMVLPELRHLQAGLDRVDSYTTNPHKWLLTNFDCSCFWVADRRRLVGALSILPPYLRNAASETGEVVDYRDWHVPLGRRFRALKLWWVLRHYGRTGLQDVVRDHLAWARELDRALRDHPAYEVIAPTVFGLVSFRHLDGDEATDALVEHLNADGSRLVLGSVVDGRRYVRVSIGAERTRPADVAALWDAIAAFAAARGSEN